MDDKIWPAFVCWRGGKPPKDKKAKCSVCKRRWSTRLCDGEVGETVDVPHPTLGVLGKRNHATCDAPLCSTCTTEAAPLIALPSGEDGTFSPLGMLKHTRRKNGRRALAEKREPVTPEADTRDFCPGCASKFSNLDVMSK